MLTRGIRQGCPLSPLPFVMVSDLVLRKLERLVSEACSRAYADDLAVVCRRIVPTLVKLARLFKEYSGIFGLRLNISKTILVPLFHYTAEELRARIAAAAPELGGIEIEDAAEYLGVFVGPGKGTSSWDAPMLKSKERVQMWGSKGAGELPCRFTRCTSLWF